MHPVRPEFRGAEARQLARQHLSYRDFVDAALFDPKWGYYSTGQVRFGFGGHYDTFPLALSPLFGRMVAGYAFRLWKRYGKPEHFEVCELGAGNGQLCLDVLLAVELAAANDSQRERFRRSFRYRIVERSPQLIRRQSTTLGPLASQVTWIRADLTTTAAPQAPFGKHGLIFANEVLDCLSHHKVVQRFDGTPGVVFVVPSVGRKRIPRTKLAATMQNEMEARAVQFEEVVLPLTTVPGLQAFLKRHYPRFFDIRWGFPPYFACPEMGDLIRRAAHLYRHSESIWIDYGELREYHMHADERYRVFAGVPGSNASIYDHPGFDDITFLVDFSVAGTEAQRAGLKVKSYGQQGNLSRLSGVEIGRAEHKEILQHRMLEWLLSINGVGAEGDWRRSSLTWSKADGKGGSLKADVTRAIREFTGKRDGYFRMMILARE